MKKNSRQTEAQDTGQYFTFLATGQRHTLSDEKTKLFLRAKQEMQVVKVDKGIVKDEGIAGENQIRKCDYLCKIDRQKWIHLIELKGKVIKDSFLQLENTPKAIEKKSTYGSWLQGLSRLDAYVVSPQRQKIPDDIDETKRRLCRRLALYCGERPENIFDLLKFVKVCPKVQKLVEKDGVIRCSNAHPLEL